jgi:NAD+ synthase
MNNSFLKINPQKEKDNIVAFLKHTFKKQGLVHAVIGISGGIDSATSFSLLKDAISPEHIIVAHLYYFGSLLGEMEKVIKQAKIPPNNIHHISIKKPVDAVLKLQNIRANQTNKIRIGNIAARMRMIILYDLAKKYDALVCGTENKSENLLGYFTRFGDQASDIEPIAHLYKTQIYQLARYLGLPDPVINQKPSAGLWHGQTDEGQFGFTYEEADNVLYLYLEKNLSVEEIGKKGFTHAKTILNWRKRNLFKNETPYILNDNVI